MVDTICVLLFPILACWKIPSLARTYLKQITICFVPAFVIFVCADRYYQWKRFGSVWGTYTDLFGAFCRRLNPGLPSSFPFSNEFSSGFLGPLFSPGKSIFLYDPLILVTLGLALYCWTKLHIRLQALIICLCILLLVTISGYARFYNWGGEAAWGNRYTTVPVHIGVLLAAPLALKARSWLPGTLSVILFCIALGVGIVLQLSSLIYPSWIETVQAGCPHLFPPRDSRSGAPADYFLIGMRIRNISADLTGNFVRWHLDRTFDGRTFGPPQVSLVPFLPFKSLPQPVKRAVKAAWTIALALLLALCLSLLRLKDFGEDTVEMLSRPAPRAGPFQR